MFPAAGALRVLRPEAAVQVYGGDVVIQLGPQADGIDVVMVHAGLRLVAVAEVEGLGFAVGRVAGPDAVPRAAARPSAAGRLGQGHGPRQHAHRESPVHLRYSSLYSMTATMFIESPKC